VRRRAWLARISLTLVALALGLAGCGSSSLSAQQLRARATLSCNLARRQTGRIPTPALPGEGARFLSRGITALTPELGVLKKLTPPSDLRATYRRALSISAGELRALRSTLAGLRAGNDPVVAIKTLQQQLVPLETRADADWRSLSLPACATA
jgi:hypothetical protein